MAEIERDRLMRLYERARKAWALADWDLHLICVDWFPDDPSLDGPNEPVVLPPFVTFDRKLHMENNIPIGWIVTFQGEEIAREEFTERVRNFYKAPAGIFIGLDGKTLR